MSTSSVSIREWSPDDIEERPGLEENYYNSLGVKVPHIEFDVRPGRDIARLVAVAALVQALKIMGHDPARTFNERLIAHMADQKAPKATSHKVSSKSPFEVADKDDEVAEDPA